ncbi:MAG: hypothetical protein RR390_08295 [Hafnia sp.]
MFQNIYLGKVNVELIYTYCWGGENIRVEGCSFASAGLIKGGIAQGLIGHTLT